MTEIRKLTNSMRSKFNACHRAYKIAYVDLVRPVKASDALSFGTAMHALLEAYWGGQETMVLTGDDYTDATLRCLFEGYKAKWEQSDAERYERVGAEFGFEAPLMNPETGGVSKTWVLAGKIDAIAKEKATGKHIIVEHKTTSQDIGPGSDYWKKLPIDGQVSGYYVGASTLGYDVDVCLYDVIRKPTIRPYKATPEENRKYKKDGTLYAGQHERDEDPHEWEARLIATLTAFMTEILTILQVRSSEALNPSPTSPTTSSICGPSVAKSRMPSASGDGVGTRTRAASTARANTSTYARDVQALMT